jgi:hypothetical protein
MSSPSVHLEIQEPVLSTHTHKRVQEVSFSLHAHHHRKSWIVSRKRPATLVLVTRLSVDIKSSKSVGYLVRNVKRGRISLSQNQKPHTAASWRGRCRASVPNLKGHSWYCCNPRC